MPPYSKYNPDQHAQDMATVLAFIAALGPIPRSDIWQGLHDQVTVGHVDLALKALLAEGRIRATKVKLSKTVKSPWPRGNLVPYTATVYEALCDAK